MSEFEESIRRAATVRQKSISSMVTERTDVLAVGDTHVSGDLPGRVIADIGNLAKRFTVLTVESPHYPIYDRMNNGEIIPPGELEAMEEFAGGDVVDVIRAANAVGLPIAGVDPRPDRTMYLRNRTTARMLEDLVEQGHRPIHYGGRNHMISLKEERPDSIPHRLADAAVSTTTVVQTGGFVTSKDVESDVAYHGAVAQQGVAGKHFTTRDNLAGKLVNLVHAPEVPVDHLQVNVMHKGSLGRDQEVDQLAGMFDPSDPEDLDSYKGFLAEQRSYFLGGDVAQQQTPANCEMAGRAAMADGDFDAAAEAFGRGNAMSGGDFWREEARARAAAGDFDGQEGVLRAAVLNGRAGAARMYQALAKANQQPQQLVEKFGRVADVEEQLDASHSDRTGKIVSHWQGMTDAFKAHVEELKDRVRRLKAGHQVDSHEDPSRAHPQEPDHPPVAQPQTSPQGYPTTPGEPAAAQPHSRSQPSRRGYSDTRDSDTQDQPRPGPSEHPTTPPTSSTRHGAADPYASAGDERGMSDGRGASAPGRQRVPPLVPDRTHVPRHAHGSPYPLGTDATASGLSEPTVEQIRADARPVESPSTEVSDQSHGDMGLEGL